MELLNYIALFCVILVPLSWLLKGQWQGRVMSLGTAIFLGYFSPISLLILTITTTSSYFLLRFFPKRETGTLVIVFQAIALFTFFKIGWGEAFQSTIQRLIPLGLSYFSFRQIHYALEFLKRKLPPHKFEDYLHYLFFLPTFLIGPINRFPNFMKDSMRRRWDANTASYGLERILYGYFKITVLGNFLLSNHLQNTALRLQETHLWWGTYLEAIKYFPQQLFSICRLFRYCDWLGGTDGLPSNGKFQLSISSTQCQ